MVRFIVLPILLFGLLNLHDSFALPISYNATFLSDRDVPADSISIYTVQYFVETKKLQPPPNSCLFYSGGLSSTAQLYAAFSIMAPMTTIWDVWTCDYYNSNTNDPNNRLRAIFANPATKQTYFENMSQAFAHLCSGDAVVMLRNAPVAPTSGLFFTTEFPELQTSSSLFGQVNLIEAIPPSGAVQFPFRRRPGTKRDLETVKFKRQSLPIAQDPVQNCMSAGKLDTAFSDINW